METKNSIKQRMTAVAAKAWGVTSKDIEKGDPVISLLIDACASEIVKVSASINESKDKMGGKIMELMTPAELSSPFPARAILYAIPMETYNHIDENNEFYYAKRNYLSADNQEVEIFFTPTGSFKLMKGEVRYMGTHKSLYFKSNPYEKVKSIESNLAGSIENDTIWIGLHLPKPVTTLDGISFYFDLENASEIEENVFYKALANSLWEIGGKSKSITTGFKNVNPENSEIQFTNSAKEFNKSKAVCNHINSFYKKKFITILEDESDHINYKDLAQKYPESFRDVFDEESLDEIDSNLLWIKIKVNQHIPFDVLQKVNCTINCFPIINRRSEKIYVNGKDKIAALISEDNEMFFDLKDVASEGNMKIILTGNGMKMTDEIGLLSIRNDNIGRFNSRNAMEMIQQMIDVYRDEFTAFSKFKDINQDAVEELHNAIRPFENVLDELYDISADSLPYVLLKTSDENEDLNVEVSYWLTNGLLANDIREEEYLKYDSAELVRDKVMLMTPTMGGIDRKRNEDLKNDLRYALLTRDRIVTKADIKALCYKIFESLILEVEVTDGISNLTLPNSGLRRTIDIYIKLRENHNTDEQYLKFLKEDLYTQLEEKSSNNLPFKIFLI